MRHLRDFCPASNTLGWRWVAGLHTMGKHYVATADNIHRFTEGRFSVYGRLNEHADPAQLRNIRLSATLPDNAVLEKDYMMLVSAEDRHVESLNTLTTPPKQLLLCLLP